MDIIVIVISLCTNGIIMLSSVLLAFTFSNADLCSSGREGFIEGDTFTLTLLLKLLNQLFMLLH